MLSVLYGTNGRPKHLRVGTRRLSCLKSPGTSGAHKSLNTLRNTIRATIRNDAALLRPSPVAPVFSGVRGVLLTWVAMTLHYIIRNRGKRPLRGITAPVRGTVGAIVKTDGDEIPTCVYNELASTRLAFLLGVPTAQGVLAQGAQTLEYASLVAATPGGRLPPVFQPQAKRAAWRYPQEAASLLVFDVLVGNWDRTGNLKASLSSPVNFFCGYDHSHTLLAVRETPETSIEALGSDRPCLTRHLFQGMVDEADLEMRCAQAAALPASLIELACCFQEPINSVGIATQKALASALVWRAKRLGQIIEPFRTPWR